MKNKIAAVTLMAILVGSGFAMALLNGEIENELENTINGNAGFEGSGNARINSEAGFNSNSDIETEFDSSIVNLDSSADSSIESVSSVTIFGGSGWAISENNGEFINILWAQRLFVMTDGSEEVRARGTMKISGDSAYHLKQTSNIGNTYEFDVTQNGRSVGTLTLSAEENIETFSKWNGKLNINSEEYEVEIATKRFSGVKGTVETDAKVDAETNARAEARLKAKADLMARIRAFFGAN